MLSPILVALHWLACLVVVLEAFNKLERTDPLYPGLTPRERLVAWLKAVAWVCLALGSAGALVRPALVASGQADPRIGSLLLMDRPSLVDLMFGLGFAVLIVRSRFKEPPGGSPEP